MIFVGAILKKNVKKVKEVLNNDAGDEPCLCGHPRRSHLGYKSEYCIGCYIVDKAEKFHHQFSLDNLMYIEKLYSNKQIEEFKRLGN